MIILPKCSYDYVNPSDPTNTVNPEQIDATWLNISTGELFYCTDNSVDQNLWNGQLGTEIGLPDPYLSLVTDFFPFNEANGATSFTNHGSSSNTMTPSSCSIDDTYPKNGYVGSCRVNNYFTVTATMFDFGLNDFCMEWWGMWEEETTAYPYPAGSGIYNGSNGFYMTLQGPGTAWGGVGNMSFNICGGVAANERWVVNTGTYPVRLTGWRHIAIVREGLEGRMYLDGNLVSSGSATVKHSFGHQNTPKWMGDAASSSGACKGWVSDFRITQGHHRYSDDFTPPVGIMKDY